MKAQSVAAGSDAMSTSTINKAILEINPNHPIIYDLEKMINSDVDATETKNFSFLLYDVARITSGYEISDSGDFSKRVMNLMVRQGNNVRDELDNEPVEEVVEPEVLK